MNKTISRHLRYRGAMVGTLCGDALGAPVEWKSPEGVQEYLRLAGGHVLRDYINPWDVKRGKQNPGTVKAGQPTDDSELAAALAQSLALMKGLKSDDLYYRLRRFITERKSLLTDHAFGMGGTLKAALAPATYEESVAAFEKGDVPTPPSNGSLMRCIGIPLCFNERPFAAIAKKAKEQSLVTHRNPESVAACVLFSLWVELVLNGLPLGEAWLRAREHFERVATDVDETVKKTLLAIEPTKPDYEQEMKGVEGYSVLSLRVAVWAGATALNFRDGIEKAICVGGDTDTYAAIAGGVLGARFGYWGIPSEWREGLQGHDLMVSLADQLLMIAHPSEHIPSSLAAVG